jgi:hypothetical protein
MGIRADVVSSFNVTAIGKEKKLRPVVFSRLRLFSSSLSLTLRPVMLIA